VLNQNDVKKIVGDYLKEKEDKKKTDEAAAKAKAEAEGYKVGTDLSMKASWQDGLVLSTPNKDFSMHIGGWVQYDNVFWGQSPALEAAPGARPGAKQGVASGAALGGIGDLQDGMFFRRIRIVLDG